MSVKKAIQIGDPILKAKNQTVKKFDDPRVKKVIKDLKDTMLGGTLIGIAAPQIGFNYRIFVTQPRKTKYRKLPFKDKLRVYINPKITKFSKEQIIIWEGCGCVGIKDMFFGPVKRPKEIIVEAFDEKGSKFQIRCDGILARVIQHETDHLNGIEFIEKVDDYKKLMHETHYTKTVRNSPEAQNAAKVTTLEYKSLA
jgi:peptide deformylase